MPEPRPDPTRRIAAELLAGYNAVRNVALDVAAGLTVLLEKGYGNSVDRALCSRAAETLDVIERMARSDAQVVKREMGE